MIVCHLTSVHSRYDTRIFLKECISLSNHGFATYLIVADNNGDEVNRNVSIIDVGKEHNRLNRIRITTKKIFNQALKINADVYHLHDPELIPIGIKLKKRGKCVIFDAHEDLPQQILSKPYLKKPIRKYLSKAIKIYERWSCSQFDAIVAATPYIREKFALINANSIDINNYPIIDELANLKIDWNKKNNQVCYLGGLSTVRGIKEIVAAIHESTSAAKLMIAGNYMEPGLEENLHKISGWERTHFLGWLDRQNILQLMQASNAGLVTLHPISNYLDSLPVKMFEYMAAGIPVIASNFTLWEKIILDNECGLCVNPLAPEEIAQAIDFLISHPEKAELFGRNGRNAVVNKFNWSIEENKLISLYQNLKGRL